MLLSNRDNKFSIDNSVSVKVLLIVSAVFAFAKSGFLFKYASIGAGAGVLGFWCLFYYAIIAFIFYKKNNNSVTRRWVIASAVIIIGICLVALIAALILDSLNDFLGFSVSYLVFNAIIFIYSYGQI